MNPMKLEQFNTMNDLLDSKQYATMMQHLDEMNPIDAAEYLTTLPLERIPLVFRMLKKDTAAEIFAELESDLQNALVTHLSDREMGEILEELATDDAVDMLEEMPASVVKKILRNATPETRAELNRFLAYPENSAGSVMTSEFIDLRRDMTCAQAVERIRSTGLDKETVYVAYVTDSKRVLQGVVPLKALLFSEPEQTIEEIMDEAVIYAHTLDDRETVANLISHYDLIALPIADAEERLVGLVTVDDAMDVLETEASDDIAQMAAILPSEKPYLKTSAVRLWLSRVPWLLLLMLSATVTSKIIASYEAALAACTILTAFIPMLMGTGGNAGSQASVTVIRGLSLDEIHLRDTLRVIWKELRVSLLSGLTLMPIAFLKVMYLDGLFREEGGIRIALVISATLFFIVVLAKLVGCVLPLIVKSVKLDPAVVANPFITTIVDALALIVYFALASRLIPILMT